VQTLKKLKQRIRRVRPNRKINSVFVLPTVPSLYLQTSIFLIHYNMQPDDAFFGRRQLKHSVRVVLRLLGTGLQRLTRGQRRCVKNEDFVGKNLDIIQGVHMLCISHVMCITCYVYTCYVYHMLCVSHVMCTHVMYITCYVYTCYVYHMLCISHFMCTHVMCIT
jgi:hypothetical protein